MTTPSGPGPYSQRTDRQPMRDIPNADYGEQTAYQELQTGAPIAASSGMPQAAAQGGGPDLSALVGLGEPTQRPDIPVTDGADAGPGADSSALGLADPDAQSNELLKSYLPAMEFLANRPGASAAARNHVRRIKATL